MNKKGRIKKLISLSLVIALMISSIEWHDPLRAQAADAKAISATYLNATVKYLHLGKENKTFNFNIRKEAQKKGAVYTWYIETDQGNPKAVTINKKTGLVTAKAAGIAYIGCKITLEDKKVITPEAKVVVRNNITEVELSDRPENSTVTAYHSVDFNYKVLNTEGGKNKKSQGITRFEIAQDTAGAGSADEKGLVFPTKKGTFKIRAVSFQTTAKYEAWLADKKANEKDITASSNWCTLKVAASKSAALVSTQSQLDKVLNIKDITGITLETKEETAFTISKGDYSTKNLIVNAPNADVKNYGSFKNIKVNAIKDSTWIEYADGNIIYLSDTQLRIVVESGAQIKRIVFDSANTVANIEINGTVDEIVMLVPTSVNIIGTAENVPVVVEKTAAGSTINTSLPLNMQLNASANIILSKGAEETVLDKGNSELDVNVDNQTSKEIIVTTNHTNGEKIKAGENTIHTASPSAAPTAAPTITPTAAPTNTSTANTPTTTTPTVTPAVTPIATPTVTPAVTPAVTPTVTPSVTPTVAPTTTPAPTDNTAPSIDTSNGTVLGTDFLTITMTFSETILNNLNSLASLKDNIVMTLDNGTTTTPLATLDSVEIKGNKLVITLSQVLIKENVRLIIRANSLKDSAGNVISTAITTNPLIKGNNTLDTATPLTVDAGEQKTWIEAENDYDIYSFEAKAGEAYNITIIAHSQIDLIYGIGNKDTMFSGPQVAISYNESDPYYKLKFFLVAPTTGTYYITVGYIDNGYYTGTTGCYGVDISTASVQTAEPDNIIEKAFLLTAGAEALTRYIYPANDVDCFKFEGEPSKTYTIQTADLDGNMDTAMYLYNSSGVLIADNDNDNSMPGTNASKIEFPVTEAGTYYVCIVSSGAHSQGKYDILLTAEATDVESYVVTAEAAALAGPMYALDEYETTMPILGAMSDSPDKTALQARMSNVYTSIENAYTSDVNMANYSGTIAQSMLLLGCLSYSESYDKKFEIGDLFLNQHPVKNYTSISEIKTAFNATITQYNSLLNEVNSAGDLTSMKQALTHLSEQYPLTVTDAVAQAILDKKITGNFTLISKIFVIDNLKKITYGATLRTVSGSAITNTPLAGVISASIDGVAASNGEFVVPGKNVTFTVTPGSGYEVYIWHVTGDYNSTNILGADIIPGDVTNNQITFTNLHTVANVQVEIVKSPIITLSAQYFTFSKSSSNEDLTFSAHPTDTKIMNIRDTDALEDILGTDKCSIDGDNITINKDYLSSFSASSSYYIFEIYYENHMSSVKIYVTITD